jgi:hypothetical protein
VDGYLRPLKNYRKRGGIQVTHGGSDWFGDALGILGAPQAVVMDDPTDALNALLHEVMERGTSYLPIDPVIPRGFCNSGFMAVARNCWRDPALQPGFQFPPHLVHGSHWTRRPEGPREQFWFFLFSLRQLMEYLAHNPIGRTSESSNNAKVAQWLANLPPRMAYVQAGDGVYTMRTLDIPPSVDRTNLNARLHFIREQTRQTYCHPLVEPEPAAEPAAEPEQLEEIVPQASRWEDG